MKTQKFFINLSIVLGVLAFANCSKFDESVNVPQKEVKLTINTSNVDIASNTKTSMSGTTPYWSTGDKIGVITNGNTANAEFSSALSGDRKTASFSGTTSLIEGDNTIYAYYPYSTIYATGTKSQMRVVLPTIQHPSLTSFDPAADVLVGKPYIKHVEPDETNITIDNFQFKRLMAVVKIVFKNTGSNLPASDKVEKVTMLAGSEMAQGAAADPALTGGVNINLEEGSFTMSDASAGNTRKNYVVGLYSSSDNFSIDAAGTNAAYLLVNPSTLASGSELTFEVITSTKKIIKTITLSTDITLERGNINEIRVNINNDHISNFNHSLPYETATTSLNATEAWQSAGWTIINSQVSTNVWGTKVGTTSGEGSIQSLNLNGFTDYVKVTFRALGHTGKTPTLVVSLLDDEGTVVKTKNRQLNSCATADNIQESEMNSASALNTMVFSGASTASSVKFATSSTGDKRFYISYVKVEEAQASDITSATVATSDATNVTGTSAKLNGVFTANDEVITEVGFEYKKSSDTEYNHSVALANVTYTYQIIDNLLYTTQYTYKAYMKVEGSDAKIYGAEKTFTTTGPSITVTTPVTLAKESGSTATLTITSLAGQAWTATPSGSGFTISPTSGTIGEGGTSSITVTASQAGGASVSDLGAVVVTLNDYTSSTATSSIKQSASVAEIWNLITSVDQITAGTYVIGFQHNDDSKYYAMKNTAITKNPQGVEFAISDSKFSGTVAENIKWTLSGTNADGFTVSYDSNYLTSTNSSQGIAINDSSSSSKWSFLVDATYGILMKRQDIVIERYLAAYRAESPIAVTFRYYNTGSSYKGSIVLLKLAD